MLGAMNVAPGRPLATRVLENPLDARLGRAMKGSGRARLYGALAFAVVGLFIGYRLYQRGFFRRHEPKNVVRLTEESRVLPKRTYERPSGAEPGMVEHETSISVAGARRSYLFVAPRELRAGKAYPLVYVMHGDGGDGPSFHEATQFEAASGENAILVYPTGLRTTWDIETARGNVDHAFLLAIADDMAAKYTIDRKKIFGTGYSSGAYVLNFMACEHPGFFRAIGSNAGSAPYGRSDTFPNGYTRCNDQKPLPMIALHGDQDFTVTLQSGRFSADYWAYVNGCDARNVETTGYKECVGYRECKGGNDVAYCEIAGLGHWVWDRHAEATWTFFRLHGAE